MKIIADTDEDGRPQVVIEECFSGVLMRTTEGNEIGICARDDGFEINVIPKDTPHGERHWHSTDMQTATIYADGQLSNSEAIIGFIAWITTREKVVSAGVTKNCAPWVDLFKEFTEENNMPEVRENYTNFLKMPGRVKDSDVACTGAVNAN